jgi:hypothetical protein
MCEECHKARGCQESVWGGMEAGICGSVDRFNRARSDHASAPALSAERMMAMSAMLWGPERPLLAELEG